MNTPTMTTKGEQAKNQLIAAALAQFGEYGLHATTRDIAAQAGQNIAAITYYFGSKEDLYLACAQWFTVSPACGRSRASVYSAGARSWRDARTYPARL